MIDENGHNPTVYGDLAEMRYYETGQHQIAREEADYIEWCKSYGVTRDCYDCMILQKIYGNYKDPDDEWKAIDRACSDCPKECV